MNKMFLHNQMEETRCNSKQNCVFQMLSRTITSSSADRNSEYTHNEGRKDITKIFYWNLVFITSVSCSTSIVIYSCIQL